MEISSDVDVVSLVTNPEVVIPGTERLIDKLKIAFRSTDYWIEKMAKLLSVSMGSVSPFEDNRTLSSYDDTPCSQP